MRVQKNTGNGIAPVAAILVLGVIAGVYGWNKSADIITTALASCGGAAIAIIGVAITRIVFAKKEA